MNTTTTETETNAKLAIDAIWQAKRAIFTIPENNPQRIESECLYEQARREKSFGHDALALRFAEQAKQIAETAILEAQRHATITALREQAREKAEALIWLVLFAKDEELNARFLLIQSKIDEVPAWALREFLKIETALGQKEMAAKRMGRHVEVYRDALGLSSFCGKVTSAFAAIVFYREEKIYLVKEEQKTRPRLPGGGVDPADCDARDLRLLDTGELITALKRAAIREANEEVGLLVDNPKRLKFLAFTVCRDERADGEDEEEAKHLQMFFACEVTDDEYASLESAPLPRTIGEGEVIVASGWHDCKLGADNRVSVGVDRITPNHFAAIITFARKPRKAQ